MNETDGSEKARKPYQAPAITRISLRPEEAVLGHCKNSTSTGPVGGNCATTGCQFVGS